MSPDVAQFLLDLLGRQQLSAGAPDLEQVTALVVRARAELLDATAEVAPE